MLSQGYEKSAHLYDLFDTKDNIPFFLHYGLATGEILDIGAGTGRIAFPLAETGVKVFCVEPSPAMRAVFEEKLSQRSDLEKRITLIEGDARGFDFGRTFSAAYLSGTFDHFLDDTERIASLANIGKHLDAGSALIFDAFIGLVEERPLSPAGEVVEGHRMYKRFVGRRILPGMILEVKLEFEVFEGDTLVERFEEISYAGIIDRAGIHDLLGESNFTVVGEFGNYRWDPYQENDALLIIEAVRIVKDR
jgi:SAM-dependent methyltransferase